MAYHLAGAYDSNIALLLAVGENRLNSFERLAEVLRTTKIQGKDLATNLEFHYGLVNWFVGNNINARPTTQFIVPYITSVGLLKQQTNKLDLSYAYQKNCQKILNLVTNKDSRTAMETVLKRKQILLIRPIEQLFAEPHILAGWLSLNQANFTLSNKGKNKDKITWLTNPIQVLAETYHYLNMDFQTNRAASSMIWDHDAEVLNDALDFYKELENRLNTSSFDDLNTQLQNSTAPKGFNKQLWQATQEAHLAYQAGCEILSILPHIATETGFYDLKVMDDVSISIPEKLLDDTLQKQMAKVLVPPPRAKSDEILASSGGMFYSREAPGMPAFVEEGDHFEAGQTLYIVEVMKMFNKVNAPFAGTIAKVQVEKDGEIIKKGQPLFKIVPDEKVDIASPEEIKAEREATTTIFLDKRL
jgi:biotin carboxyl carrier protein